MSKSDKFGKNVAFNTDISLWKDIEIKNLREAVNMGSEIVRNKVDEKVKEEEEYKKLTDELEKTDEIK